MSPSRSRTPLSAIHRLAVLLAAAGIFACGKDSPVDPTGTVQLGDINIVGGPRNLEIGSRDTLRAVTLEPDGDTIEVPVVWRSSNEKIAVFERGGVLVTRDTGQTVVVATALGVVSDPIGVRVIWLGPSKIEVGTWAEPSAHNPSLTITDSLRVIVTNPSAARVPNVKVAFTVSAGGGSMSPTTATTGPNGVASAQWTLGPNTGTQSVTAAVVRDDGTPNPFVTNNAVTFSLTSYNALTIAGGNEQTGQILAELPIAPSVKLVDANGNPRPGVPVTFTAYQNGQVATPVVSTDANGVATPGKWTLGDIPGQQRLDARVSDARVTFTATATGTPTHYKPAAVVASGYATCALESDGTIKCWGEPPQNGSGGTSNVTTPTKVAGTLTGAAVFGGITHFCALNTTNDAWCWGTNAMVDTSGATTSTSTPTKMPTDLKFSQMGVGFAHNCGITSSNDAWCWGANGNGQLGDLTTTGRWAPVAVSGSFKFSRIAGGFNHTCALSTAQTVFCWGANQFGQIGDATTTQRTGPTAIAGGTSFQYVGAGDSFSCGLSTTGQAYCWGLTFTSAQTSPTAYPSAPTFVSMTVGGGHACALTGDGAAWCWGNNGFGQVGDSSTTTRNAPVAVAGGFRFTALSAGLSHTCGLTTDGAVACWGRNRGGELGESQAAFRLTPRHVILGVQP